MATTGYFFLEPTKRPLVRRLFHVPLFRPILPILGKSTMRCYPAWSRNVPDVPFLKSSLTFHNNMTLHPGFRRMVFSAGHCIPTVSPSSVASNLRNSPGMLRMTSLLWNSTLTLLKYTWVASVIKRSLRYRTRLLLYSQLSCEHLPKRISWRNLMKLSSVVVRRFKVINSYRWGTTYNHKGDSWDWPTLVEHINRRQLKKLSNDYDLLSTKRFCHVTFLCQIVMNIICNFQNSSTWHRRLVPEYASCPSYFISNLITSSCAITNISPRQIRGLQTMK